METQASDPVVERRLRWIERTPGCAAANHFLGPRTGASQRGHELGELRRATPEYEPEGGGGKNGGPCPGDPSQAHRVETDKVKRS